MSYTIYAVEHCPSEMLASWPDAALYADKQVYLFGENLEEVAGIVPDSIIDIKSMELTNEELDAYVDKLLANLGKGEARLSNVQGRYLYDTRFKPAEVGL